YKLSDQLEALVEKDILSDIKSSGVTGDKIGKAYRIDDARGRYIEYAKQSLGPASLAGMKVIVDCGHGAGYLLAPLIFKELGAKVVKMGVDPDGTNINAGCGALHPEAAGLLVREHGADVGISLDGDADRVIFSDASGAAVSGDRILALCALALHQEGRLRGDKMVCTVMSNLGLHESMRHAALQVLRMMRNKGATLADLAQGMQEYPQSLVNMKVKAKVALEKLSRLQETLAKADAAFGQTGRHLIRYSGTENKLRILVEHREQGEVDRWSNVDALFGGFPAGEHPFKAASDGGPFAGRR
ncbi:MAG: phosphoglucosamine mutase, partial [Verrucomicrobia bacterium]|nr:phosphoglucosamine mutase [Verrucomicrobiota bacterium]